MAEIKDKILQPAPAGGDGKPPPLMNFSFRKIAALRLPLLLFTLLFILLQLAACGRVTIRKTPQTARPGSSASTPETQPRTLGERIAGKAKSYIGTPYRYGGASPKGFDCSGLTSYVFAHYGYKLPREAKKQMGFGKPVSRSRLKPGDLVFFKISWYGNYHVGIFIGDGKFVHAPSSGKKVEIQRLDNSYYRDKYFTARRVADSSS